MVSSRLFWKLFVTFVGLTLLSVVAVSVLTYQWERRLLEQRARQQLRQTAAMGQRELSHALVVAGDDADLQAIADRLAVSSDLRVTVISLDGQVLAETAARADVDPLENQRQRPEVVAALADGQGYAERQSQLVGESMLFFARRIERDGTDYGIIRTAYPKQQLAERLQVFGGVLTGVTLAITLVTALVTYAVVRHLVKPILTLNASARAIARGEHQQRVFVPGNDELAALARSFNDMSHELGTQLSELRASDQRQATVLGGMVEGVVAVDARQRVLFANSAAGRLFGFDPAATRGRPLLEVIRHHNLHDGMQQVIQQGTAHKLDIEWQVGGVRQLAVQITPLPGQPCPGAVIVMHDNTELRRLETIRSEFMANVSHELKTPLSSIKAYCETLMNGAVDDHDNRHRFLQRIEEQGDRLNDLIQDMLSLARIESAQQHLDLVTLDVGEVVGRCVDDYRARAESKQIALLVGESPPADVVADEEALRVVLGNLVDNALKYTPRGGQVEVAWQITAARVQILVKDNGPGISQSDLPRIFERFYRVDKARSRELGSTGLGLSIVKHLAQSLGGTAGVESTLGTGSIFWVDLPRGEATITPTGDGVAQLPHGPDR